MTWRRGPILAHVGEDAADGVEELPHGPQRGLPGLACRFDDRAGAFAHAALLCAGYVPSYSLSATGSPARPAHHTDWDGPAETGPFVQCAGLAVGDPSQGQRRVDLSAPVSELTEQPAPRPHRDRPADAGSSLMPRLRWCSTALMVRGAPYVPLCVCQPQVAISARVRGPCWVAYRSRMRPVMVGTAVSAAGAAAPGSAPPAQVAGNT